jgi:hypothetical protein
MFKNFSVAFAAILTLAACAAQVKPMTTPDGNQGFLVACDGSADDWSSCYEAATKACQGKYRLIDRNESSTPTAYGPLVRRQLIAECKK